MKRLYIILTGALLAYNSMYRGPGSSSVKYCKFEFLDGLFEGVLNAAYFYQHASATPMAVMGDFRSDNALMDRSSLHRI